MVSEGEHLHRWIQRMWATGFETRDNHRVVMFPASVGQEPVESIPLATHSGADHENGAISG